MAITNVSKPSNWSRAADTNQFVYKFSSDKYTQPNFRYYIELYMYDNSNTSVSLGTYLLHPSSDGTCEFNPSAIYQNYLSYDINLSATGLTELFQTVKGFKVLCNDYYGQPPVKEGSGNYVESPMMVAYNGAQQIIPYTYTPLTPSGNTTWVMNTGQTGRYLTDYTAFKVDDDALGFVYCLGNYTNGRPNKVRYTVYHYGYANNGAYGTQPNEQKPQQTQASPSSERTMDDPNPIQIINRDTIYSAVTYETTAVFSSNYTFGYYIPVGPNHVFKAGGSLTGYTTTWVYYDVDIMYNTTVLNKIPVRYIRTQMDCKYEKWELFWLNKHGGFDNFIFDKKNELNYKVDRITYKQKLPPNYSPYSAGEKVLNIESQEQITLRTRLLTQQEVMMITDLTQSPVVYSAIRYLYNGTISLYGSPYIVMDNTIKYEQKVNDKEVYMEITLRPANERIIQRN